MADVAQLRLRRPSGPQLPVSWYFDPEVFQKELMPASTGQDGQVLGANGAAAGHPVKQPS